MCVFVFCTLTTFSHYLLTYIVSAEKPAFNLSCCSRFCPCLQVSMLLVYNVYLWISTFILPVVCWASWKYAAAAKSLQSCPTLCDPRDNSPPASPSLGFSRQEHWNGLPFSSPMHESGKWKVKVKSLSRVRLLVTPWTAAYQAPPSMGFSRQEYWSGVPLPSPSWKYRLMFFINFQLLSLWIFFLLHHLFRFLLFSPQKKWHICHSYVGVSHFPDIVYSLFCLLSAFQIDYIIPMNCLQFHYFFLLLSPSCEFFISVLPFISRISHWFFKK